MGGYYNTYDPRKGPQPQAEVDVAHGSQYVLAGERFVILDLGPEQGKQSFSLQHPLVCQLCSTSAMPATMLGALVEQPRDFFPAGRYICVWCQTSHLDCATSSSSVDMELQSSHVGKLASCGDTYQKLYDMAVNWDAEAWAQAYSQDVYKKFSELMGKNYDRHSVEYTLAGTDLLNHSPSKKHNFVLNDQEHPALYSNSHISRPASILPTLLSSSRTPSTSPKKHLIPKSGLRQGFVPSSVLAPPGLENVYSPINGLNSRGGDVVQNPMASFHASWEYHAPQNGYPVSQNGPYPVSQNGPYSAAQNDGYPETRQNSHYPASQNILYPSACSVTWKGTYATSARGGGMRRQSRDTTTNGNWRRGWNKGGNSVQGRANLEMAMRHALPAGREDASHKRAQEVSLALAQKRLVNQNLALGERSSDNRAHCISPICRRLLPHNGLGIWKTFCQHCLDRSVKLSFAEECLPADTLADLWHKEYHRLASEKFFSIYQEISELRPAYGKCVHTVSRELIEPVPTPDLAMTPEERAAWVVGEEKIVEQLKNTFPILFQSEKLVAHKGGGMVRYGIGKALRVKKHVVEVQIMVETSERYESLDDAVKHEISLENVIVLANKVTGVEKGSKLYLELIPNPTTDERLGWIALKAAPHKTEQQRAARML